MQNSYDVVIIGGGMVGAVLAAALATAPLNIALIEDHLPEELDNQQEHDLRVSALSLASQRILSHVGAWPGIIRRRACPYRQMKVWELNDHLAATVFDAGDLGYPHLGHIVENRVVQLALMEQLRQQPNLRLFAPAKASQIDYSPGSTLIELDDGQQLIAKLLVAADGGQSRARQAAGIGVHSWDYRQQALVLSVVTDYPQQAITWQQFRPTGPLAFLPLSGQRASLVWYNSADAISRLAQLDDQALLDQVHQQFPAELGQINQLLARGSFPLRRQHAQHYVQEGVALIGDAAHLIHPLAGQGVNIGLLDAAALAQVLLAAQARGESLTDLTTLRRYPQQRRQHNLLMMQTMDLFYRVFSNDQLPLKLLRNIGLGLAGRLTPARKQVMAYAMGLKGPLPQLARE